MANAKSRLKAPKSATTKRGRGKTKRSPNKNKNKNKKSTDSTTSPEDNVVMRRPSNLITLTTEEKVKYLLQNGHLLKDQFLVKPPPKPPKQRESAFEKPKPLSRTEKLLRTKPIISPDGSIKHKTRSNLRLIDDILKGELMINNTSKPKKATETQQKDRSVNNNNELGISDQNETNQSNNDKKKSLNKTKDSKISSTSKTIKKDTAKRKNQKKDTISIKSKTSLKTKQVTLSNGLVLTLTLFQCDYCQKMFSGKSSLRRHIYGHLNVAYKPLTCKKCPKKFRNKIMLQTHLDSHHADTPYLCNICDKTFTLEENLTLHLATHVKNENAYKCIYCDKKFSYNVLLTQHEKQHLVTGRYQCTICSMSYDCRNHLSMHMKSHLKIKDYICQYCGKEFQRMNSMRRHVQICHGGHRIQCPICKKKLKGHLTEHMRTHKQARPHECDQCGQRFTQSTQLTVHKRSHTGIRPYACRICERPFAHSNALMLHIRRHTGEKPFSCAMCPMSFSQLPHMKAHMRNIHGKDLPYKCPKCDEFFKLKCQLENHTKSCTVGERELTFEERIQASVQYEEVEVESPMSLSRMRFLLALLFTMIATKEKLKFLGKYLSYYHTLPTLMILAQFSCGPLPVCAPITGLHSDSLHKS